MDLRDPTATHAAIMFANRMTILRHRALRAPLIVERDGVILELDPFSVLLPEEAAAANGPSQGKDMLREPRADSSR